MEGKGGSGGGEDGSREGGRHPGGVGGGKGGRALGQLARSLEVDGGGLGGCRKERKKGDVQEVVESEKREFALAVRGGVGLELREGH